MSEITIEKRFLDCSLCLSLRCCPTHWYINPKPSCQWENCKCKDCKQCGGEVQNQLPEEDVLMIYEKLENQNMIEKFQDIGEKLTEQLNIKEEEKEVVEIQKAAEITEETPIIEEKSKTETIREQIKNDDEEYKRVQKLVDDTRESAKNVKISSY